MSAMRLTGLSTQRGVAALRSRENITVRVPERPRPETGRRRAGRPGTCAHRRRRHRHGQPRSGRRRRAAGTPPRRPRRRRRHGPSDPRCGGRRAVATGAGGEAGRAGLRLAAGDRGPATDDLVAHRRRPRPRSHCSSADSRSLRRHSCGRAGQLAGQLDGHGQRPAGRGDPVDEPDPLGLGAVDAPAGEDQVHRPAVADQPGQAHRAEVDERHAEAPAVHAEDGIDGGHPQVTPQGQLQPPGHGGTLDGRDDRLAEPHAGSVPSGPDRPRRPGGGRRRRAP